MGKESLQAIMEICSSLGPIQWGPLSKDQPIRNRTLCWTEMAVAMAPCHACCCLGLSDKAALP